MVADPEICHGKPMFLGTRIMVAQVLKQVSRGMPWDAITAEWRCAVTRDAIAEAVELASGPSNWSKSMSVSKRRYSKEEFARRGDALVESKVRPNLTMADEDKFVAIDIETGEYELDRNEMKAADRLRKQVPDPQIWLVHVTLGYLHRFGGHGSRGQS